MGYEKPPFSRAIYVAPLTLDKDKYNKALHNSYDGRYLLHPFNYLRHQIMNHGASRSSMEAIPILRENVSIIPHEKVSDDNHYYAYSEAGVDISWHSPQIVNRSPSRLSDFLGGVVYSALSNPDYTRPLTVMFKYMLDESSKYGYEPQIRVSQDNVMGLIADHGHWLHKNYNIKQLLLLTKDMHKG